MQHPSDDRNLIADYLADYALSLVDADLAVARLRRAGWACDYPDAHQRYSLWREAGGMVVVDHADRLRVDDAHRAEVIRLLAPPIVAP